MINEPFGEGQILTELYEEIAKNIRSKDPDRMLFLSPSLYLWLVCPILVLCALYSQPMLASHALEHFQYPLQKACHL